MIDELRIEDYKKIKLFLDENFEYSGFDGIYWLILNKDILSKVQFLHIDCQPYYFAIELKLNCLSCELLVRSKNAMQCNCICYATENQRNWLIRTIDSIIKTNEIIV